MAKLQGFPALNFKILCKDQHSSLISLGVNGKIKSFLNLGSGYFSILCSSFCRYLYSEETFNSIKVFTAVKIFPSRNKLPWMLSTLSRIKKHHFKNKLVCKVTAVNYTCKSFITLATVMIGYATFVPNI